MKGPVYIVKPKNIFKHPFNKFDFDKPTNRQSQNDDLTDYFNYGFNEDTMNIYAKLVKRTIEVLDINVNPTYFDSPSQLMRLNDQIPMDFGGFGKFFDPSIFVNKQSNEEQLEYLNNYHNGQRLFQFFIYLAVTKNQNASQYPLIDFVKCMYNNLLNEDVEMCDVMEQIQHNLQIKYQQVMRKLNQAKNNLNGPSVNSNSTNNIVKQQQHKQKNAKQNEGDKKSKKDQQPQANVKQSESQSEDGKEDSSNSSQSSESHDRKKKKNKSRKRSETRSKDRKKKKIKKEDRRDKNRKQKRKQKSKKKSKSRDKSRDRNRKKEKSKKHRN